MPARLPNKGDCIFAHLDDGDYVGYIKDRIFDANGDEFVIHWLLRPEQPQAILDVQYCLRQITEGKIKVLSDNFLIETNIDKPRFDVGDLLVAQTSKGKVVGYILRSIIKGYEVTLPDSSKHHCQFFYIVNIPKQKVTEETSDGARIEYLATGRNSEVPEVLIEWGLFHKTIEIHKRANKT